MCGARHGCLGRSRALVRRGAGPARVALQQRQENIIGGRGRKLHADGVVEGFHGRPGGGRPISVHVTDEAADAAQFATGVAIDADNVRGIESLRSEAEACARQLEVLDAEIEAAWEIGRMLALGYAPPP